jgi:AraC-like DNA-binding protein
MRCQNLFRFKPPYEELEPITTAWELEGRARGDAIIWQAFSASHWREELEFAINRSRGVSLIIVLPPASQISDIADALPHLGVAYPHAVVPAGRMAEPAALRLTLALPPRALPTRVIEYLERHRIIQSVEARTEIKRIFELAPKTPTISRLCRDMYTSRRTLGRHFESHGLPVPSHWLQFARLLHVILRAQCERTAIFRLAVAAGYPDGFTLSNQMKRLIGYRPTEVRGCFGFEWLLEEWLAREKAGQS